MEFHRRSTLKAPFKLSAIRLCSSFDATNVEFDFQLVGRRGGREGRSYWSYVLKVVCSVLLSRFIAEKVSVCTGFFFGASAMPDAKSSEMPNGCGSNSTIECLRKRYYDFQITGIFFDPRFLVKFVGI